MKTNTRFFAILTAITLAQAFAFAGTTVPEKISFDSVPTTQPYVALTFDDGPSSMLTPQVLKILADRNVKATFFVVGESAQSHPDIIKLEVAAGHEVGSRSWSHSIFSDIPDTELLSDLQRTDRAIKTATGNSPRLFSPFEASFTPAQCDAVNKQFGYTVIYWSVDSLAAKNQGPAAIANTIVSQAKPGSIIMSSDIDSNCVAALPMVIDALASKGYKFVTVPELIAVGNTPPKKTRPTQIASISKPKPATAASAPVSGGVSHPFGVANPWAAAAAPDPDAANAGQ